MFEKLGFNEKKYDWFSFDMSIKGIFVRHAVIASILFAISVFMFVLRKMFDGFLVLAIVIIYLCYLYYRYLYFCYGKFDYLVGECISIERKVDELFKRKYYEKCTMTLLFEGKYYIMNVKPRDEVKKGSEVIVYMGQNSLSEVNENTYEIDNPFAYTVLSHPNLN